MIQAIKKYGRNNANKDSGVGWLLLYCINAPQKDTGRLGMLGSIAKCESQRTSVVALKEPCIPCSKRTDVIKGRLRT